MQHLFFEMLQAKKAYNYVNAGIKKVQAQPWASPLGEALEVTGAIFETCGEFVPGLGLLGGALSVAGTLLNPDTSNDELQKELREMKTVLTTMSKENAVSWSMIQENIQKLEDRIANPPAEIRTDFDNIRAEMMAVLEDINKDSAQTAQEVASIKDIITKTYNLVVDVRYKVQYQISRIKWKVMINTFRTALKR